MGYGKMGKEIEQIVLSRGHKVIATIDPKDKEATHKKLDAKALKGVDVAIDFTHPSVAVGNVEIITEAGVNLVMGTTGWYDDMDRVRSIVKDNNVGFFWASNFSIGVNMFFKMVQEAAAIVDKVKEYDIAGYEIHHNQKADSPSGTAKSIAEILQKQIARKKTLEFGQVDRQIKPSELHFASVRVGNVPGTHGVVFDSPADTIELKHTARNREGFALGAVMAAEFVAGKKGFFEIENLMDTIVGGGS